MTDDDGTGVGPVKLFEERTECGFLPRCASVLGIALCVESTFVTDADRVAVVVFDMSSHHRFWATFLDAAITSDDVVIADAVGVATGPMPRIDLGCAAGLGGLDCAAMYYE